MLHHAMPAAACAAIAAFQRGDLGRARSIAENELAKSEQLPMLHHLLGLIDCRLGRFKTGIERLKQAVRRDPTNISYRLILARALIDGGRPAEALEVATPAGAGGVAQQELWQVRAEAAFHAGDRATETEAWQKICAARPEDPMAWASLGRSLLAQYRFTEAEQAYRTALAIAPILAAVHELGLTLERANQLKELGELLETALADGVPKEQLLDLWALKALRTGDIEEAWRLAERIDTRPDPFRLNGLVAKIADAAGQSADAFGAAIAMNHSASGFAAARLRGRAYRESLRERLEIMNAWPEALPALTESGRRNPAFLVGFPRSGTTLADTFLMGHPDVAVVEEEPMLETAARVIGGVGNLTSASKDQLSAARDAYFAELDRHLEPGFTGLVVDKMPLNMLSVPLIAGLFPGAPIVFAQRHPCDCVLSGLMQGFVLNDAMASFLDLADAAELYDIAMRLFDLGSKAAGSSSHRLVYEHLVAHPEAELKPLITFLGLEWHPELLDHRATAARRGTVETPSYDGLIQPLSKRPSGRWKQYEQQMAPVLPILMPWAERLGYQD